MKTIVFALPGNESLAKSIANVIQAEMGEAIIRQFPDGETFLKINSDVNTWRVIVVCTLDRPDSKFLPLYFMCRTLKELGASRVELVAPYLAYMRQDKRFHDSEAVTSDSFAALLSGFVDRLITVDPHLHRHHSLSEIYSIPAQIVPAADSVSEWIINNVQKPLLIGPDEESGQWVKAVALAANAPFEVLLKKRRGDNDVEVSIPHVEKYRDHMPVLVDDIISTAHTMIEIVKHLQQLGMQSPVCIGVHAIFAGDAYNELLAAGASEIVTCNTVLHISNKIDLSPDLAQAFQNE